MRASLHLIKIGNQTNKPLVVIPNNLPAQLLLPRDYMYWDSIPVTVKAHVFARDRDGNLLNFGSFEYNNLMRNYADIHIGRPTVVSTKEGKKYYTLYDYIEGDTIHPFACVEKSVWDSLPDRASTDEPLTTIVGNG